MNWVKIAIEFKGATGRTEFLSLFVLHLGRVYLGLEGSSGNSPNQGWVAWILWAVAKTLTLYKPEMSSRAVAVIFVQTLTTPLILILFFSYSVPNPLMKENDEKRFNKIRITHSHGSVVHVKPLKAAICIHMVPKFVISEYAETFTGWFSKRRPSDGCRTPTKVDEHLSQTARMREETHWWG